MKAEMESLAKDFVKLLEINPQMKRMDSLMIASSCKQMSRLEIFYRYVSNMVKAVQATGEMSLLDSRLLAYLDPEKENNTLYRIDSSQTQSKLEEVCADAVRLWEICADGYQDIKEYGLLERVVQEQTQETEHVRSLRSKKEIRTDSLQNPSDEEATFREKNIQLITTALIGKSPDAIVADYVIDEEQHILL